MKKLLLLSFMLLGSLMYGQDFDFDCTLEPIVITYEDLQSIAPWADLVANQPYHFVGGDTVLEATFLAVGFPRHDFYPHVGGGNMRFAEGMTIFSGGNGEIQIISGSNVIIRSQEQWNTELAAFYALLNE